jgi:acetate kinase
MKILVLNSGSSSIKFQLYDTATDTAVALGLVERIGFADARLSCRASARVVDYEDSIPDHIRALELVTETLCDRRLGVLGSLADISAVGHRVVHGGDLLTSSVVIDETIIASIEQCVPLAPLHNPANLNGIREVARLLPGIPQVAVFDTAFHTTMAPAAYLYALPYEYFTEHRIRRYGFHGTSYRYVCGRLPSLLGHPLNESKVIVAHLGNGASIAAIDHGRSVDTSMGMTPLEGLVMGTRSGDVDAGILFHLHRELGYEIEDIDRILNKESGLLGLSGLSSDVREIVDAATGGDPRCAAALGVYTYRIKKYVGAYAAAMGGVDTLVFTGGVGENSSIVRAQVCAGMEFLGIRLHDGQNEQTTGTESEIGAAGAAVRVFVVPTDEERMIAIDTAVVVGQT